jgi:redox-sensing transcriptional repressor
MSMPIPSIKRLCRIYELLTSLQQKKMVSISSADIGMRIQVKAHTVRKDINLLGEIGPSPLGYPVEELRELIRKRLHLNRQNALCVVGLGAVGLTVLQYTDFLRETYPLLAGFDSNINRLETINTNVPLYPFHAIADVVQAKNISLAILATTKELAHEALERLENGGVRGVINLTGALLNPNKENIWIKDINIIEELRILSACLTEGAQDR